MMRKAIVVGSAGQDGQLLWPQLANSGYTLLGCTRSGINSNQHGVSPPSANIHDAGAVADLVARFQPDEIYFLAAHHHSAEEGNDNFVELFRQSLDINVLTLVNFLEAIRRHSPTTRLFYAASSHVFGAPLAPVQDESTPINPNSAYGISKAAGLFACRYYRRHHSVFASVGILYNHESVLRSEKFLSRKLILGVARVKHGATEMLTLGNLDAVADWGYAPDYTDAMRRILVAPAPDDFIIATGEARTVREFAEIAFGFAGLDYTRHVVSDPSLIHRNTAVFVGNPKHLIETTGWKPTIDFKEMVHRLVAHELGLRDVPNRSLR